jgi:pimeloyl-ACP methyl ester carboxylesterase
VLLVHGWNGRATQMGGFVSPLLRAGYWIVAVDAPGHGDSAGRHSSVLAVAGALLAVGKGEGPYHAAVTHSFGCAGLLKAMSDGLSVARVACISPPNRFEWLIAAYAQALQMSPAVQVAMMRQLEARYGADFWERVAPDALAGGLRIPGLIIHDRDDNQVPWRQGRDIARAWPGAEFILTRGQGHSRILYHRDTIRRVRGFIGRPGWGEIKIAGDVVDRSRYPGKLRSCFDSRRLAGDTS